VKPAVRELDRLVFAPVRALLGDARNVLLAPDGALNLVPFGALADEAGRYLVSRYLFVYLTSGRDLLRLQQRVESRERPLIVANPRFGGASRPGGGSPRTGEDPAPAVRRRFIPLPATLSEARAIGVMLPGASMLTGKDATETALKGVHGPAILHVATHGFFRDGGGAPAGGAPEGSGQPDGAERRAKDTGAWEQIADPLLRAGLALAGANEPAPAGDDGILTAMEAAGLDLWGTKLVVLSACDTGVGEASNGDGVYGLRRALVIAGSGSQVISLWSVTDAETRDLMVAFYRALRAGRGPAEALRQAQLRLLGRGGTSHPFFWASFIASGEWRAIKRPGPRIR
jgi:CHAT domain-containing protein